MLVDAELAFIVEMWRRGARNPKLRPRAVRLRRAQLDPGANHEAYFGCRPRLRAKRDAIVLALEDVALRFSTHNQELLDALLPYLNAAAPKLIRPGSSAEPSDGLGAARPRAHQDEPAGSTRARASSVFLGRNWRTGG